MVHRPSGTEMKQIPGNGGPVLISSLLLALKKMAIPIESNFLTKDCHIVKRKLMATVGDFQWQIAWSAEWNFECLLMNMHWLSLIGCHGVAEHIKVCGERFFSNSVLSS